MPNEVNENEFFNAYVNCENCGSLSNYFYVEITIFIQIQTQIAFIF